MALISLRMSKIVNEFCATHQFKDVKERQCVFKGDRGCQRDSGGGDKRILK